MSHFKREAILNYLLLTITIVVPLLIYTSYRNFIDPDRYIRLTEINLLANKEALRTFIRDIGRLPTSKEGLQILVNNGTRLSNWKGPYISETALFDGWNRALAYVNTPNITYIASPGANHSFDTTSEDIAMGRKRGDDLLIFVDSR